MFSLCGVVSVGHNTVAGLSCSRPSGFALVLALGLMAFLLLLVVALGTLGQLESEVAVAQRDIALARQHAVFALDLAMAELQEQAGPDQRVTAKAELVGKMAPGAAHWTGLWDFTAADENPAPKWLVSGNTEPNAMNAPPEEQFRNEAAVWLVWKGTVAVPEHFVAAPLVDLTHPGADGFAAVTGRYAYWVGDEGVKASALAVDRVHSADPLQAQFLRQRANPAHSVDRLLPGLPSEGEAQAALLGVRSPFQFEAAFPTSAVAAAWREHRHDVTVLSEGLLTNVDPVSGGGLRLNLATNGGSVGGGRFDDPFARGTAMRVWEAFPRLDSDGRLPLTPISGAAFDALAPGEPYVSVAPVLGEVMVRLAVYNHWQRREPAIRYYLEAEFLNPFTVPLLLREGDQRAFTVSVSNLPLMEVENLHTGLSTGPLPIDEMKGTAGRETAAYMQFDDNPRWGFAGDAWLLPGETYRLKDPDPVVQGRGVVKYSGVDLAVEEDHDILVTIEPPPGTAGANFAVHAGENNLGELVWEMRNVPYDRSAYRFFGPLSEDAKPYIINSLQVEVEAMHIFGFHYGLGFGRDWRDEANLGEWRESVDLRRPYLDYGGQWQPLTGSPRPNASFVRVASHDPVETETDLSALFPGTDWIYDDLPRNSETGSYSDLRLYDVPIGQPVSLADFRLLPFKGMPPRALGSRSGGILNAAFDRYFLATVPEEWAPEDGILPNSRLHLNPPRPDALGRVGPRPGAQDLRGEDAAQHFRLRGAFNWHSTSEAAWRAVLTQAFSSGEGWTYFSVDGDRGSIPIEGAVFRHNLTAPAAGAPLSDADFRAGTFQSEALRGAYFRQGVRRLAPTDLGDLAGAIVEALRLRGRPFPSLAAFLDSGLLADALDTSGVNDGFPRHANGHISQSDLVALLSLGPAVRSDTFLIRAYGEVWNRHTERVEGRAALEALVQRTVEYVDSDVPPATVAALPRRFEVIAFRWLDLQQDL